MAAQKSFNKFSVAVIVSIVVIQCLGVAASSTCIGCLELDELTFDKILKKFPTVLVKFDIAYPYGDKHEAYAKLAAEVSPTNGDFAVAVVGIKDYGNKENSQLAERFSVGDKYPVIKLFRNGNANEWIDYPKDLNVTVVNLRQFVRRHSNIYMALNGCLQRFDELAIDLVSATQSRPTQTERVQSILQTAEEALSRLEDDKDQVSGKVYVLFMKRIQEKGLEFVSSERKRLQHLLAGKISDNKKAELNQKLNILSAFNHDDASPSDSRSEL